MTEYERDVRAGLRAVRRVERRLDANQEKLQRRLRRMYYRKTVPRKGAELQPVMVDYQNIRVSMQDLERALADWANIIGGYRA